MASLGKIRSAWSYWSILLSRSSASSEQKAWLSGLMNLDHGLVWILTNLSLTSPAASGTPRPASSGTSLSTCRDCPCLRPVRSWPTGHGYCLPWRKALSWRSAWDGEYHWGEHGASWPDIQRVIVVVVINQQLRSLKVPWSHSNVVILPHVVKLSQAPIDQLQDLFMWIDDDVLRLDVTMHDALAMAIIQCLRLSRSTFKSSKR